MRSLAPLGVLGLIVFAASGADAATIIGTVTGPDGAPFRAAFVQARHVGLKMTVSVLTDNQEKRFEIDQPEKDSYRARRTGVVQTIVIGGGQTAVIDDAEDLGLDAAVARYARDDLDLLVVEGFKAEPLPKIEVARAALSTELLCLNDRNLVATVTDFDVRPAVPHFELGDASAIADFIGARIGR